MMLYNSCKMGVHNKMANQTTFVIKYLHMDMALIAAVVVAVLQVSVLQGALDCWVFLSCLEVLHRIEGCCDRTQLEANFSHTVGLWTYATEKVLYFTHSV